MTPSPKAVIFAAVGLAATLLLAGCSGSTTTDTSSAAPPVVPSAAPTASASATPKDVLFTISANVRDKSGNTIAIQFTAHTPLPYSSRDAKPLVTQFVNACGATAQAGSPITADGLASRGAILMPIELASSVVGKQFAAPIDLELGNVYFGQSATGKGIAPVDPQAPCSVGYTWSTSGVATAISDFESGIPGPQLDQWKNALYGFAVESSSGATIEACKVALSPVAKTVVAGIPGWDSSAPGSGLTCDIGYVGE